MGGVLSCIGPSNSAADVNQQSNKRNKKAPKRQDQSSPSQSCSQSQENGQQRTSASPQVAFASSQEPPPQRAPTPPPCDSKAYTSLIFQQRKQYAEFKPTEVSLGDYGRVDKETGNFTAEGNIFIDFPDLKSEVGLEKRIPHGNDYIVAPARRGGAVEDITTSKFKRKTNDECNFQGAWRFKEGQHAILILIGSVVVQFQYMGRIARYLRDKKETRFKHLAIVTELTECDAYAQILSSGKAGEASISYSRGKQNVKEGWDKQCGDALCFSKKAGRGRHVPLFSLQTIGDINPSSGLPITRMHVGKEASPMVPTMGTQEYSAQHVKGGQTLAHDPGSATRGTDFPRLHAGEEFSSTHSSARPEYPPSFVQQQNCTPLTVANATQPFERGPRSNASSLFGAPNPPIHTYPPLPPDIVSAHLQTNQRSPDLIELEQDYSPQPERPQLPAKKASRNVLLDDSQNRTDSHHAPSAYRSLNHPPIGNTGQLISPVQSRSNSLSHKASSSSQREQHLPRMTAVGSASTSSYDVGVRGNDFSTSLYDTSNSVPEETKSPRPSPKAKTSYSSIQNTNLVRGGSVIEDKTLAKRVSGNESTALEMQGSYKASNGRHTQYSPYPLNRPAPRQSSELLSSQRMSRQTSHVDPASNSRSDGQSLLSQPVGLSAEPLSVTNSSSSSDSSYAPSEPAPVGRYSAHTSAVEEVAQQRAWALLSANRHERRSQDCLGNGYQPHAIVDRENLAIGSLQELQYDDARASGNGGRSYSTAMSSSLPSTSTSTSPAQLQFSQQSDSSSRTSSDTHADRVDASRSELRSAPKTAPPPVRNSNPLTRGEIMKGRKQTLDDTVVSKNITQRNGLNPETELMKWS